MCITLHNLLLERNNNDPDSDNEFYYHDDISDIDANNELNQPINEEELVLYERNRREQLTDFFKLSM